MKTAPAVSVIMASYNSAAFISEAVGSILNQTFTDFELIVIDDGSSDSTPEIVRSFGDPRIVLLQNKTNLGVAASRNYGISTSRGKYIAIMDSDDISSGDRLQKQVEFLNSHHDYGMVGSWFKFIDASGELTGQRFNDNAAPSTIPCILLFECYFGHSTALIRRDLLGESPYRYHLAEDYDLWTRLARVAKIWCLPEYLLHYRVHGSNISKTKAASLENAVRQIVSEYLCYVGVRLSDSELDLHREVATKAPCPDIPSLRQVESWLLKIKSANLASSALDPLLLDRYLGLKWYEVCRASTGLGVTAWKVFNQSQLASFARVRMTKQVRLFLKCLT